MINEYTNIMKSQPSSDYVKDNYDQRILQIFLAQEGTSFSIFKKSLTYNRVGEEECSKLMNSLMVSFDSPARLKIHQNVRRI